MAALSGGNISEESFAISTAILAAPYAAVQTNSLDDPGLLGTGSVGSQKEEVMDKAMALGDAASALRSLVRGWNDVTSCFMYSITGDTGGRPFVGGVAASEDFFSKVMHGGGKTMTGLKNEFPLS